MPLPEPRYLGDGVYASYDGYHINLAVNHHENHAVSIDPEVLQNFLKFSDEIQKALAEMITSDVADTEQPSATN